MKEFYLLLHSIALRTVSLSSLNRLYDCIEEIVCESHPYVQAISGTLSLNMKVSLSAKTVFRNTDLLNCYMYNQFDKY